MSPYSESKAPPKFKGEIHIIAERCKGCGFCIQFCPTKVLKESSEFNSKGYHPPEIVDQDKCVGCNLCGLYCPDFAIYSIRKDNNKNNKKQ